MKKGIVCSIVVVLLFCFFGNASGQSQTVRSPRFKIRNLNNKGFKSSKVENETIVVSFFYTRCRPCTEEMPQLYKAMKHAGKERFLLFIDPYVTHVGFKDKPDSVRSIRRFVNKLKIPYANVYFDSLGKILKKFQETGVFQKAKKAGALIVFPTIVVIDKKGNIVRVFEGAEENFLAEIEELL